MRRSTFASTSVAILALSLTLAGGPAGATETLASAGFESDLAGSTAHPGGQNEVLENLNHASSGSGGVSEVVSWSGGMRYRLSDAGVTGLSKGVSAPLSETVSSGTVVVEAVLAAEQTDGAAQFFVQGPLEGDPPGLIGFGSNGNFTVHGLATSTAYTSGHRYRVTITLHLDGTPSADYLVVDLDTSTTVIDSTGHSVASGATAGAVLFVTGASEEGGFTIDDILVTR